MKNYFYFIGILLLVDASLVSASQDKSYISYSDFKAITDQAPHLKKPRLAAGMTDAAYQLWEKGQLRVPAQGHWAVADLDQDGREDAALVVQANGKPHVLIASRDGKGWKLRQVVSDKGAASLSWDGKLLRVHPKVGYIAWTGSTFSIDREPLSIFVNEYSEGDFSEVQLVFIPRIGCGPANNGPMEESERNCVATKSPRFASNGILISSFASLPKPKAFPEAAKVSRWMHFAMSNRMIQTLVGAVRKTGIEKKSESEKSETAVEGLSAYSNGVTVLISDGGEKQMDGLRAEQVLSHNQVARLFEGVQKDLRGDVEQSLQAFKQGLGL
jgi:hypothetical protein